jgi:arylsulfatase A-like enzyme
VVTLARLIRRGAQPVPALGLLLAGSLLLPFGLSSVAEAGRAFRADHTEIWQPRFHPTRERVVTGLAPPKRSLKPDSPNIILITVDTWRADRLSLYGAERSTSPWLDAFAEDALVFERAVAPSSWTWPTMASIATGLYPGRHAVQTPDAALCSEATTLAESLHSAGWRTGFVGSNQYFEPQDSGYRQGFEFFWAAGSEAAPRVLEYSGYFLDGAADEPFFLHAHFFDPHCPYDPSDTALAAVKGQPGSARGLAEGETIADIPVELALQHLCHVVPPVDPNQHDISAADWSSSSRVQDYLDYYDAELLETDQGLRDFATLLASHKDWENSWVIITGDHGEEFFEHGTLGHGANLYAESTWVPLIIRPPGGLAGGGRRISEPVSLVDITPTLLDAAGLNPFPGLDGWSLMSAVRGETLAPRTVFAETIYQGGEKWWLAERFDRRLLVETVAGKAHMHLASDIMDRKDLLSGPVDTYAQMRAAGLARVLHKERERQLSEPVCTDSTQSLDAEHKEQLRSLGYTTD